MSSALGAAQGGRAKHLGHGGRLVGVARRGALQADRGAHVVERVGSVVGAAIDQPQNVQWVFVAGRALKEKGRLTGVDHGALLKAAQAASSRIKPFIQP